MFRWWDGSAWTPSITANRFDPPPLPAGGQLPMYAAGQQASYDYGQIRQQSPSRRPLLALGLVGVLVVALLVGGVWLVQRFVGNPFTGEEPASNPTGPLCPTSSQVISPTPHVNPPGRVQGGALSYPQLGSPWGAVFEENRLAFGRDVFGQMVTVHENYGDSGNSWVASLLVGELVAGDGFFSPEQGSEIVTRCIIGAFYGDAKVAREDRVNEAATVDGYDAWLVEMHLTFNIPGLDETGETAIVLIVATGEASSSIYYASIPDSTPQLLTTARDIQAQLKVEA